MKTPPNQTAFESAPSKANLTSKDILAEHFCCCRPCAPCIFCRHRTRPQTGPFSFPVLLRIRQQKLRWRTGVPK